MFHSVGNDNLHHNISTSEFEEIIKTLSKCEKEVLFLEEAIESKNETVCLTFDDGYKNYLTKALPIMEKYNTPSVLFVCPKLVKMGGKLPSSRFLTDERDFLLSDEDIHKISEKDLVKIGNHTLTHLKLTQLDNYSQSYSVETEVNKSLRMIEKITDNRTNLFSYPYGEYNDKIINIVNQNHNYAVTAADEKVTNNNSPLELPRIKIYNINDLERKNIL